MDTSRDVSGPFPVTQYAPAQWVGELLGWVYDVADLLGGKITYDAVRTDPNISSRFVQELKDIFTAFRKDQFMAFSVDRSPCSKNMDPMTETRPWRTSVHGRELPARAGSG